MRLVWGTVARILEQRSGVQRLAVDLDDGSSGTAISYVRLAGACSEGERVVLNTTACDLSLGTGGVHFVVSRQGSGSGVLLNDPCGGHVMKMRYAPLQVDVISVEAQESEHHEMMRHAESLDGLAVVCCGLHSQVPLVAAAVKRARPEMRVVYCMTDHAALPLALSEVISQSVDAGLVDATVTCGQAFGGTLEAVNLHSGMLAALHVLNADVAIVAIGPGVVGTGTPWGHGGVAQGEAVNAVTAVGGTPVFCLRASFADARDRHRGVSHHSVTALSRVALAPAIVAVPSLSQKFSDAIREGLYKCDDRVNHRLVDSPEGSIEPPPLRGVEVRTMGRGAEDDPAFFACAYAAGEIASRIALGILN